MIGATSASPGSAGRRPRVLVLATRNPHKVEELRALLTGVPLTLRDATAYPQLRDVVEDGATLADNALKKAREVAAGTGELALADDTGLLVTALDGAPGVFSSRYAGEGASYADNCRKLLDELQRVGAVLPQQRQARFLTVVAIVDPRGPRNAGPTAAGGRAGEVLVEGEVAGEILLAPRGTAGFGYDPLFWVASRGKTLAEMSLAEKNELSHRAAAVRKAREVLERIVAER